MGLNSKRIPKVGMIVWRDGCHGRGINSSRTLPAVSGQLESSCHEPCDLQILSPERQHLYLLLEKRVCWILRLTTCPQVVEVLLLVFRTRSQQGALGQCLLRRVTMQKPRAASAGLMPLAARNSLRRKKDSPSGLSAAYAKTGSQTSGAASVSAPRRRFEE